jgi:hypothetical protein
LQRSPWTILTCHGNIGWVVTKAKLAPHISFGFRLLFLMQFINMYLLRPFHDGI